ncbi:MAG: hypothetical protein LBT86_02770 [Deltaproteobacteria bacterium]|jgi:hypothetical protein|nr:hypothetical protein [Deltaproteobacteria bacterium]
MAVDNDSNQPYQYHPIYQDACVILQSPVVFTLVKAEAKAAARVEAAETNSAENVETKVPAPTETEVANKVTAQREEQIQTVGEISASDENQKNAPVNVASTVTMSIDNWIRDKFSLFFALDRPSLGGSFSSGSVPTSNDANIATVSSGDQSFSVGASSSGSSPASSVSSALNETASSSASSSSRGSDASQSSSNVSASDSKKSSGGSSSGRTSSSVDDDEA